MLFICNQNADNYWWTILFLIIQFVYIQSHSTVPPEFVHRIVQNPEPIDVPIGDLVSFDCVVALRPERFEWIHLPKWPPSFEHAKVIDQKRYENRGNSTKLQFNVADFSKEGGYQCVAWYGAIAVASTPARLSVAQIDEFKRLPSEIYLVTPGNTVIITCPAPKSNPSAQIEFRRQRHSGKELQVISGSLILQNVTSEDSDIYSCTATNYILSKTTYPFFNYTLNVGYHKIKEAPKFLKEPPNNYTVLTGENITLECSAVGTPPPIIIWRRLDSVPLLPRNHFEQTPLGLKISNVNQADEGTYVCEASNGVMPTLSYHITLMLNEMPVIVSGPMSNDVTEGENLELECQVKARPEATVSWLINSRSVHNDSRIEAIGTRMYINPVEKRHAGIIQCFATNIVGTVYSTGSLTVYPKQSSYDSNDFNRDINMYPDSYSTLSNKSKNKSNNKNHGKNRHQKNKKKMVPPSRPNITRLSDTSVMVRWNVPENDGVPIMLFKVQYRELSSNDPERNSRIKNSKWMTLNANIPPTVTTHEVDNLYTDSIYKFRVAAVYSNNDNKSGPNSAKFHLQRGPFIGRNPLPTPTLTHTEAVNQSAVRIYWTLDNNTNETIDGFYIYYRDNSNADDYFKETVDDPSARSCLISHLGASKVYEFKLQTFTQGGASDFSAILTRKTLAAITNTTNSNSNGSNKSKIADHQNKSILYILIAVIVGIAAFLIGLVSLLIIYCRRYRKKEQNSNQDGDQIRNNKRNSNEISNNHNHLNHIHVVESKDYKTKIQGRNRINTAIMHNGCIPPGPKLTITNNPLAIANVDDDKNQIMEMTSFIRPAESDQSDAGCSVVNHNQQKVPKPFKSDAKYNNHLNNKIKASTKTNSSTDAAGIAIIKSNDNYV